MKMINMRPRLVLLLYLLDLLVLVVYGSDLSNINNSSSSNSGSIISLQQCHDSFLRSDSNNDGVVVPSEYYNLLLTLINSNSNYNNNSTTTPTNNNQNSFLIESVFASYNAAACACLKYPEPSLPTMASTSQVMESKCCGTPPIVLPYALYPEDYINVVCLHIIVALTHSYSQIQNQSQNLNQTQQQQPQTVPQGPSGPSLGVEGTVRDVINGANTNDTTTITTNSSTSATNKINDNASTSSNIFNKTVPTTTAAQFDTETIEASTNKSGNSFSSAPKFLSGTSGAVVVGLVIFLTCSVIVVVFVVHVNFKFVKEQRSLNKQNDQRDIEQNDKIDEICSRTDKLKPLDTIEFNPDELTNNKSQRHHHRDDKGKIDPTNNHDNHEIQDKHDISAIDKCSPNALVSPQPSPLQSLPLSPPSPTIQRTTMTAAPSTSTCSHTTITTTPCANTVLRKNGKHSKQNHKDDKRNDIRTHRSHVGIVTPPKKNSTANAEKITVTMSNNTNHDICKKSLQSCPSKQEQQQPEQLRLSSACSPSSVVWDHHDPLIDVQCDSKYQNNCETDNDRINNYFTESNQLSKLLFFPQHDCSYNTAKKTTTNSNRLCLNYACDFDNGSNNDDNELLNLVEASTNPQNSSIMLFNKDDFYQERKLQHNLQQNYDELSVASPLIVFQDDGSCSFLSSDCLSSHHRDHYRDCQEDEPEQKTRDHVELFNDMYDSDCNHPYHSSPSRASCMPLHISRQYHPSNDISCNNNENNSAIKTNLDANYLHRTTTASEIIQQYKNRENIDKRANGHTVPSVKAFSRFCHHIEANTTPIRTHDTMDYSPSDISELSSGPALAQFTSFSELSDGDSDDGKSDGLTMADFDHMLQISSTTSPPRSMLWLHKKKQRLQQQQTQKRRKRRQLRTNSPDRISSTLHDNNENSDEDIVQPDLQETAYFQHQNHSDGNAYKNSCEVDCVRYSSNFNLNQLLLRQHERLLASQKLSRNTSAIVPPAYDWYARQLKEDKKEKKKKTKKKKKKVMKKLCESPINQHLDDDDVDNDDDIEGDCNNKDHQNYIHSLQMR